jgi:hypothetical protein
LSGIPRIPKNGRFTVAGSKVSSTYGTPEVTLLNIEGGSTEGERRTRWLVTVGDSASTCPPVNFPTPPRPSTRLFSRNLMCSHFHNARDCLFLKPSLSFNLCLLPNLAVVALPIRTPALGCLVGLPIQGDMAISGISLISDLLILPNFRTGLVGLSLTATSTVFNRIDRQAGRTSPYHVLWPD